MITTEDKAKVMATTQKHATDVGSPQAQVAVMTERIKQITAHLQTNKHDHMGRRGLIQLVGKRRKLLKYLERVDFEAYKSVITTLKLRK